MKYISTEYDKDLKQEVFKITGAKGYVNKTDTILKRFTEYDGSFTPVIVDNIDYFEAEFTLEVYRDVGDSKVVIYDNGAIIPLRYKLSANGSYSANPVEILDWSDQYATVYVKLQLAYEVEHSLTAKYLGNSGGLPSVSLDVPLQVPAPSGFVSAINCSYNSSEISNSCIIADTSSAYSISVEFDGARGVNNKSIKVYEENTLLTTLTTDENGNATLSPQLADGEHQIRLVFEGDESYLATEKTFTLYLGTTVSFSPIYSKYAVGQNVALDLYVQDYAGNPIANQTYTVNTIAVGGIPYTETTDENGKAIFDVGTISGTTYYDLFKGSTVLAPGHKLSRIAVSPKSVYVANMGITGLVNTDMRITGQGEHIYVHANLEGETDLKDYLVTFDYPSNSVNVRSNSEGGATLEYIAQGRGNVTIGATCGDTRNYVNIIDCIQYWNPSRSINKSFVRISGKFRELANYYRLEQNVANGFAIVGIGKGTESLSANWQLQFSIVSATSPVNMYFVSWNMSNGESQVNIRGGPVPVELRSNNTVVITKKDGLFELYVNGVSKGSVSYSSESRYPAIAFAKMNGYGSYINFKDLIFMRL